MTAKSEKVLVALTAGRGQTAHEIWLAVPATETIGEVTRILTDLARHGQARSEPDPHGARWFLADGIRWEVRWHDKTTGQDGADVIDGAPSACHAVWEVAAGYNEAVTAGMVFTGVEPVGDAL